MKPFCSCQPQPLLGLFGWGADCVLLESVFLVSFVGTNRGYWKYWFRWNLFVLASHSPIRGSLVGEQIVFCWSRCFWCLLLDLDDETWESISLDRAFLFFRSAPSRGSFDWEAEYVFYRDRCSLCLLSRRPLFRGWVLEILVLMEQFVLAVKPLYRGIWLEKQNCFVGIGVSSAYLLIPPKERVWMH